MQVDVKYLGKWVAIKNDKIVASDTTLTKLSRKIGEEDRQKCRFTLIPKGCIA